MVAALAYYQCNCTHSLSHVIGCLNAQPFQKNKFCMASVAQTSSLLKSSKKSINFTMVKQVLAKIASRLGLRPFRLFRPEWELWVVCEIQSEVFQNKVTCYQSFWCYIDWYLSYNQSRWIVSRKPRALVTAGIRTDCDILVVKLTRESLPLNIEFNKKIQ